jgi:hypothetical protein
MSSLTPRFELPLLIAGQGQKDITHNEAIVAVDLLAHPFFESRTAGAPPPDPQPGQMWIVPPGASGAWQGQADRIAAWTAGGWRFIAPAPGTSGWIASEHRRVRWTGAQWRTEGPVDRDPEPLQVPSGGTVVDVEARAAVVALQGLLRSLGFAT